MSEKQYTPKHGDGVLFKNNNKKTEKHPDWTGNVHLNGKDYWLSGWVKEAKSGTKYLSISVGQEKLPKDETTKAPTEDVPFDI